MTRIGFCPSTKEPCLKEGNHGYIGGSPSFPSGMTADPTFASCKSCNNSLSFIAQLNTYPNTIYYIFACASNSCHPKKYSDSYRLYRTTSDKKPSQEKSVLTSNSSDANTLPAPVTFQEAASEKSSGAVADDIASLLKARAVKRSGAANTQQKKSKPSTASAASQSLKNASVELDQQWASTAAFPCLSIRFEESQETRAATDDNEYDDDSEYDGYYEDDDYYEHEQQLLREYEKEHGPLGFGFTAKAEDASDEEDRPRTSHSKGKPDLNTSDVIEYNWEQEEYENNEPSFMTKDFKKFSNALKQHPNQIIRIDSTCLDPCWFQTPNEIERQELSSACARCGLRKVCKLQFMPHLASILSEMEKSDQTLLSDKPRRKEDFLKSLTYSLDFTTIVGFVCPQDCPSEALMEETLIVQVESLF